MGCNEEFSYSVQQRLRLLAIAFPVYCDYTVFSSVDCNKQGILLLRPAAPATPGINRHNSQATVQSYSWDCNVPDQLHAPLPIVQFAGFHNCFQQLLSSKTIVKCFALLGEYSPMENYK